MPWKDQPYLESDTIQNQKKLDLPFKEKLSLNSLDSACTRSKLTHNKHWNQKVKTKKESNSHIKLKRI